MRAAFLAVVLSGVAVAAAAQSHGRGLTDDMPTPSIGLPLPQMGLPPERGERPQPAERFDRSVRPDRSERQRAERSGRSRSVVIYVPTYGWPYLPEAAYPAAPSPPPQVESATGQLYLNLRSGVDPQIFVDGYYVGLFSDSAGHLTLDPGRHTLELRDEGYETLHVAVNIGVDQVITYDVDLNPTGNAPLPSVEPAPAPPSSVPAPSTIYVIPGCYVGNVPPKDAHLPADCDPQRAVAFPSRR